MREREVGTLWIGGALSWLEQLCLKSFVDRGQKITLFSYHDIPNVPEGVIRRDGREILDTGNFLKYERKDSFALFADQFRILMLQACPGMIWVDTDVYCHRPMAYDSDVVMGFELPESHRVNNAVLGLPPDHPMLIDMLAFMEDPFTIPPFVKPQLQAEYREAAARGQPVHVSQQPWGTWGPLMLTWFAGQHAMHRKVLPMQAFYPIPFPDRLTFLKRRAAVEVHLTPATTALHLWASNKRELGLRHEGLPPPGSYLEHLVKTHGIRPEAAPIKGRGKRLFDAGLIEHIDLEQVARVADIGGNAQSFVLAAQARWGCAVDLVDVDHRGRFCDEPSPWVAPYQAFLADHGVPPGTVRRVGRADEAVPADLAVNLVGFGDLNKIGPLPDLLDLLLAPGGRLLTDIRKGSGGFPVLKARGVLSPVLERDDQGVTIARVVLAAAPAIAAAAPPVPSPRKAAETPRTPAALPAAAADPPGEPWSALARRLAGPEGFVREGREHSFLYVPRGKTLVVTFDNLDIAMEKREDRRPWGYAFIEKQGWSMLGVMANGWTWFRDPWVSAQFDDLADSGFFARFDRVVFYGASMGGYGAAAFVPACPGADVVAISPQSSLDRALTPWETRYSTAWGRDFSGPYGDAAEVSAAAGRVVLLYDPYEPLDSQHVARFTGANVLKLRAPLMGHRLGSSLQQMGILSQVTLSALDGTLTEAAFYKALRARKSFPRYQRELFQRALDRGHPTLARRMGRWVLTRGDNRAIRKALAELYARGDHDLAGAARSRPAPGLRQRLDPGPVRPQGRAMLRPLAFWLATTLAAPACETALVLAIDVSGSIDGADYRLQADGLAAALADPGVAEALVRGQVALSVLHWSGTGQQAVVLPWRRMLSAEEVAAFAAAAAAAPRAFAGSDTAVGEGLRAALAQFAAVPDCRRKVVDISGDGPENAGFTDADARSEAVRAGVAVNAIAIEEPGPASPVTGYYRRWILTPGGFVMTARGLGDYARTLRLKLLRELDLPAV